MPDEIGVAGSTQQDQNESVNEKSTGSTQQVAQEKMISVSEHDRIISKLKNQSKTEALTVEQELKQLRDYNKRMEFLRQKQAFDFEDDLKYVPVDELENEYELIRTKRTNYEAKVKADFEAKLKAEIDARLRTDRPVQGEIKTTNLNAIPDPRLDPDGYKKYKLEKGLR